MHEHRLPPIAEEPCPTYPCTHSPPRCRAIDLVQPTAAWLIAAPPSNSVRTHSTCPRALAMNSGVAPSVCHAAWHSHQHIAPSRRA
jgi:hypothetical protein